MTDLVTGLHRKPEQRFVLNLFIAFLPAAIIGLALTHKYIKAYLFSPLTVGAALIVGGFLILVIERWHQHRGARTQHGRNDADGRLQGRHRPGVFALPGTSRSGATIMGGLLAGLSRTTATEFSFFLAMPTMFAATLYDLYKNLDLLHTGDIPHFAVGFVAAFLVALVVVKLFLGYVARHNFAPFAWYRIGFGCLVLAYFLVLTNGTPRAVRRHPDSPRSAISACSCRTTAHGYMCCCS